MGVEIAMGWPGGTPTQFWEVREGFPGLMSPLTPKRWIGTNKVMWVLMRPSKRWEQHVQSPRGKEDQGSCTAAIQPPQAVDALRKTEKKWTNFIFLHPYSFEFVSVSQRSQVEPRIIASCVEWLMWSYFFELTSDGVCSPLPWPALHHQLPFGSCSGFSISGFTPSGEYVF